MSKNFEDTYREMIREKMDSESKFEDLEEQRNPFVVTPEDGDGDAETVLLCWSKLRKAVRNVKDHMVSGDLLKEIRYIDEYLMNQLKKGLLKEIEDQIGFVIGVAEDNDETWIIEGLENLQKAFAELRKNGKFKEFTFSVTTTI